jgi:hypothetical protein
MDRKMVLVGWLVLAGVSGCGADTVSFYEVECDDDAIGWAVDFADLVELPPPEFGVECASGWGHGVETRAAAEVVELPNAFQSISPHPEGGLLLWPYSRESLWSERLGVDVAENSLAWLDERAEELRWLRDDLSYRPPIVVSTEAGTELWVWGSDDEQDHLSRIEPSTGEVLERVALPEPDDAAAAWPEDGGLWQTTRSSYDEDFHYLELQRMSSFATLGPVLRTIEVPRSRMARVALFGSTFTRPRAVACCWESGRCSSLSPKTAACAGCLRSPTPFASSTSTAASCSATSTTEILTTSETVSRSSGATWKTAACFGPASITATSSRTSRRPTIGCPTSRGATSLGPRVAT